MDGSEGRERWFLSIRSAGRGDLSVYPVSYSGRNESAATRPGSLTPM